MFGNPPSFPRPLHPRLSRVEQESHFATLAKPVDHAASLRRHPAAPSPPSAAAEPSLEQLRAKKEASRLSRLRLYPEHLNSKRKTLPLVPKAKNPTESVKRLDSEEVDELTNRVYRQATKVALDRRKKLYETFAFKPPAPKIVSTEQLNALVCRVYGDAKKREEKRKKLLEKYAVPSRGHSSPSGEEASPAKQACYRVENVDFVLLLFFLLARS